MFIYVYTFILRGFHTGFMHTCIYIPIYVLNMCVCVCGLCVVGVEDGDALKDSSGSTDASALSSLSLQAITSVPREPRHWRRRSSATPPSNPSPFMVSVRVVVEYLTGASLFFGP